MGFEGMLRPVKIACNDHEGSRWGRIHQWDGKAWKVTSDWYEADVKALQSKYAATAKKYAAEGAAKMVEADD